MTMIHDPLVEPIAARDKAVGSSHIKQRFGPSAAEAILDRRALLRFIAVHNEAHRTEAEVFAKANPYLGSPSRRERAAALLSDAEIAGILDAHGE
jgi:hypothetical protein